MSTTSREPLRLVVHLRHQRAGRVEHGEPAPRRLVAHRARDAVRAEDHRRAVRDGVQFLDEDRPQGAQPVHDEAVVHDLVAHVDRRAEQRDRALDDADGAIDAGAEAARIREQDLHAAPLRRRPSSSESITRKAAPTVMALSATLNAGK
jgi:hypothetical protein